MIDVGADVIDCAKPSYSAATKSWSDICPKFLDVTQDERRGSRYTPTNPATCRFGTRPSTAVTVFSATITMTTPSLIVANCPTSLALIAPKPVLVVSPVDAP